MLHAYLEPLCGVYQGQKKWHCGVGEGRSRGLLYCARAGDAASGRGALRISASDRGDAWWCVVAQVRRDDGCACVRTPPTTGKRPPPTSNTHLLPGSDGFNIIYWTMHPAQNVLSVLLAYRHNSRNAGVCAAESVMTLTFSMLGSRSYVRHTVYTYPLLSARNCGVEWCYAGCHP